MVFPMELCFFSCCSQSIRQYEGIDDCVHYAPYIHGEMQLY